MACLCLALAAIPSCSRLTKDEIDINEEVVAGEVVKRVFKDGKFMFTDEKDVPMFATKFDYARDYSENRAVYFKDGLWGMIDEYGGIVYRPSCRFLTDLRNGKAYCTGEDMRTVVIDGNGQVLKRTNFLFVRDLEEFDPLFKGTRLKLVADADKVIEKATFQILYKLAGEDGKPLTLDFLDGYRVMDGRWLILEGTRGNWHFFDLKSGQPETFAGDIVLVKNDRGQLKQVVLGGEAYDIKVHEGEAVDSQGRSHRLEKKNFSLSHVFFEEFERSLNMDPVRVECERRANPHFYELCDGDTSDEELLRSSSVAAKSYCFLDEKQVPVNFSAYLGLKLAVCNEQYYMEEPSALQAFVEDRAVVRTAEGWGAVNRQMKTMVPFKYMDALPVSGGMMAVRTDEGWGYVDASGKTVIEPKYREARRFFDDVAVVGVGESDWMVIDKQGVPVVPPLPAEPMRFSSGLSQFRVKEDGVGNNECGNVIIDKKGRIVDVGVCL